MFVVVWMYRVHPDRREQFEGAYGPRGEWARLFAMEPGFIESELLRSGDLGDYLTIDRWDSQDSFDRFMTSHREEYQRLDIEFDSLTDSEQLIARGTSIVR